MTKRMSKATIASASSPSRSTNSGSTTQPRAQELPAVDLSADNVQVRQHFPAQVRRRRSVRARRVVHKATPAIPPAQSELVEDSVLIQLKMKVKLHSNEPLKFKVGVEDEAQEDVDSKVMKLRITVSKLKTINKLVSLEPDTSKLLGLAAACCEPLVG